MLRSFRSSCLLVLGLAGLSLAAMAPRAGAVTVSVSPADTTVGVGDTFTLRVVVDAVADLKAYQLIYRYGPVPMQYQGSIAGDVLTGSGFPYAIQDVPDAVAPLDTAWVDCAQLDGSAHGPGVLVYFKFKATHEGDSPVLCQTVDLRDSHNVPLLPACAGGIVHVIGPTPTIPRSWGRLKALYR